MQRLAEVRLEGEKVDIPLLKQFSEVIVEDSTSVSLPAALAGIWLGCGEEGWANEAAVKAFVRWNMLNGAILGPRLTDGRTNDNKSAFSIEELPEYSLYFADLQYFAIVLLWVIVR